MTTLSERIKISTDLPGGPADVFTGEVIATADGRYLGDFRNLTTVPWGLEYPVGWTNGTWYETPAAYHAPCVCTDCAGEHQSFTVKQRYPDELVTANDAGPYEFWDHAIAPQKYVGVEGCGYVITDANCTSGGVRTRGKCAFSGAHFSYEEYAGWPLCPFSLANPSSRIRVVADASGPVGFEDRPALEIDFSGANLEGTTFVGDGGGFDGASPANGYNDGDRCTTGWDITDGSCWTVRFWAKAVPDFNGFVCDTGGYKLYTRVQFYPFPFFEDTLEGENELVLTNAWQEFYWTFRARWTLPTTSYPDPMLNAPLAIVCIGSLNQIIVGGQLQKTPQYAKKGRIHIKQVHVYPCALTTGVHIAKRIGGQP